MAGPQDELDRLLNQRIDSGAQAADEARGRLRREAAARAQAERLRIEQEKAQREWNTPGRVQRGLRNWINPEMYRAPAQPSRPSRPSSEGGVRGMLPFAPPAFATADLRRRLQAAIAAGMLPLA